MFRALFFPVYHKSFSFRTRIFLFSAIRLFYIVLA